MADSSNFFSLYEAAAGYALLEVVALEEINPTDKANQDTITDLSLFSRSVKLKAFQPFASAEDALENANAISEHAMTDSLKSFLEMNLPKTSSKKKKEGKAAAFVLGVIDSGLATAISEGIPGISVRSDDTVREISRGARLHLTSLIKGLSGGGIEQAQLGLGHSYSRGRVKFNPARSDNMIIQSIALLDQMDKDLNTFAMRVREWYSWHFPELKDIVKDNYMFARCAAYIQDKKSLFAKSKQESEDDDDEDMEDTNGDAGEDKLAGLIEIVGEEELAKSVIAAAKTSMGMDCSAVDMINIINFTQRMVKLAEYRKQLALYLTDKMAVVAPNLSALIGDTVAARLISKVWIDIPVCIFINLSMSIHDKISQPWSLLSISLGWIINQFSEGTCIDSSDSWC
jgi:nucleolar protein 56